MYGSLHVSPQSCEVMTRSIFLLRIFWSSVGGWPVSYILHLASVAVPSSSFLCQGQCHDHSFSLRDVYNAYFRTVPLVHLTKSIASNARVPQMVMKWTGDVLSGDVGAGTATSRRDWIAATNRSLSKITQVNRSLSTQQQQRERSFETWVSVQTGDSWPSRSHPTQ